MKSIINNAFSAFGYELCRLSENEKNYLPRGTSFNYKEAMVYRALTASGQISIREARFLSDLVRGTPPERPIVEVGALYGFSTIVLCMAKHPSQKLYVVDNFSWNSLGVSPEVHYEATKARLSECINDFGVTLVRNSAAEFYSQYSDNAPALFFCDADHEYESVRADITWAKEIGASIICGDDYAAHHTGVKRAVDEFGGPTELQGELWRL